MKVLSFGEILLRLAAPGYTRLFQEKNMQTSFCGGEANVAVSLALLGVESQFLTKLPNTDVGQAAINELRYFGVDCTKILKGTGRMGLYYLEKGASQRASKVIYDRQYSSLALATTAEFNWEEIFRDVDWFHWTGITPALSESCALICAEACREAKKRNIKISCDLNYRSALWSGEDAMRVMTELLKFVDVCIANEEDAEKVLGIKAKNSNVLNAQLDKNSYCQVARQISEQYACEHVAITLRESYSASDNGWSAILYNRSNDRFYQSTKYEIHIVDRVGGGDSFSAGLIYGLISGMESQQCVEFATAASCLKHSIEGDFNRVSLSEIMRLVEGNSNGRVQR